MQDYIHENSSNDVFKDYQSHQKKSVGQAQAGEPKQAGKLGGKLRNTSRFSGVIPKRTSKTPGSRSRKTITAATSSKRLSRIVKRRKMDAQSTKGSMSAVNEKQEQDAQRLIGVAAGLIQARKLAKRGETKEAQKALHQAQEMLQQVDPDSVPEHFKGIGEIKPEELGADRRSLLTRGFSFITKRPGNEEQEATSKKTNRLGVKKLFKPFEKAAATLCRLLPDTGGSAYTEELQNKWDAEGMVELSGSLASVKQYPEKKGARAVAKGKALEVKTSDGKSVYLDRQSLGEKLTASLPKGKRKSLMKSPHFHASVEQILLPPGQVRDTAMLETNLKNFSDPSKVQTLEDKLLANGSGLSWITSQGGQVVCEAVRSQLDGLVAEAVEQEQSGIEANNNALSEVRVRLQQVKRNVDDEEVLAPLNQEFKEARIKAMSNPQEFYDFELSGESPKNPIHLEGVPGKVSGQAARDFESGLGFNDLPVDPGENGGRDKLRLAFEQARQDAKQAAPGASEEALNRAAHLALVAGCQTFDVEPTSGVKMAWMMKSPELQMEHGEKLPEDPIDVSTVGARHVKTGVDPESGQLRVDVSLEWSMKVGELPIPDAKIAYTRSVLIDVETGEVTVEPTKFWRVAA